MNIQRDNNNQIFIEWEQMLPGGPGTGGFRRAWIRRPAIPEKDWAGTGRYVNVDRRQQADRGGDCGCVGRGDDEHATRREYWGEKDRKRTAERAQFYRFDGGAAGIVPQNTAQPGAVIMTGVASTPPSGDANPGNLSISGQRENSNGFRVNGATWKKT